MDTRVEFWKNALSWPRDTKDFVFLGRAVHVFGRSMFPSEWKIEDAWRDSMPSLHVTPFRFGAKAVFVHELLMQRHPEFGRKSRWSFNEDTKFEFSQQEWDAARAIVLEHNERVLPGSLRFSKVIDRMILLAENGALTTALRDKSGGDPELVPRGWWDAMRIRHRFDYCQLNPNNRFGDGSSGHQYHWIFVTRESLAICANDPSIYEESDVIASLTREQSPVTASISAPRKPSRIAEADIEPAFARWRAEHQPGNIPTVDEDIAYMKTLGVSRERVRKLRKNFESRKRGERKS